MASANVYSPDYDNNGNPKSSIPELKDAIENAVVDAENFASATGSFTDDNGNSFAKGAKGWATDAEGFKNTAQAEASNAASLATSAADEASDAQKHAQETSSFTDHDGNSFDKGALGYSKTARTRNLSQFLQGEPKGRELRQHTLPINYVFDFSGGGDGFSTSFSPNPDYSQVTEVGDGTIKMPAGAVWKAEWKRDETDLWDQSSGQDQIYVWVVQTDPIKGGSGLLDVGFPVGAENDGGNIVALPDPVAESGVGVYRYDFQPYQNIGKIQLRIENTHTSEVEILFPIVSDIPVQSVLGKRERQYDFGEWEPKLYGVYGGEDLTKTERLEKAQRSHDLWSLTKYLSASGNDSNSGDRQSPLATLASSPAGVGESVGVLADTPIREDLSDSISDGVRVVGVYDDPNQEFAQITAFETVPDGDWSLASNQNNTYTASFTSQTDLFDGSGGKVYLISDDGSGGASARQVLVRKSSISDVEATPGTCYAEQGATQKDWTLYVHPHGSTDPSADGKTYKATSVRSIIETRGRGDERQLHIEGLHLQGGQRDNGVINGAAAGVVDRCAIEYGTLHHFVFASGLMQRAAVIGESPTDGGITCTFFDDDPERRSVVFRDSYVHVDGQEGMYAHQSAGGQGHEKVLVDNVWFYNQLDPHTNSGLDRLTDEAAIDSESADKVEVRNSYFTGWENAIRPSSTSTLEVHHNFFYDNDRVYEHISGNAGASLHDNVYFSRGTRFRGDLGLSSQPFNAVTTDPWTAKHNLLVSRGVNADSSFDPLRHDANGDLTWKYNVVVLGSRLAAVNNEIGGQGVLGKYNVDGTAGGPAINIDADYNIYVYAGSYLKYGLANHPSIPQGVSSLDRLQQETGEEQNSIELNFMHDPRGLRAIFKDPIGGDFRLADTRPANILRDAMVSIYEQTGVMPGPDRVPTCAPNFPSDQEAIDKLRRL